MAWPVSALTSLFDIVTTLGTMAVVLGALSLFTNVRPEPLRLAR